MPSTLKARSVRFLHSGWLEVALATLLAVMAVVLGLEWGNGVTVALDLAAYAAAAASARWPRAASIALASILVSYLWLPHEWVTVGEYAALIPIVGAGMRGQKTLRTILSVAYLAILTALQYHDYPDRGPLFLFAGLTWAFLIAACWLVGSAFAALNRRHIAAEQAALARQRLTLARDLHDTVARSVARLSLIAKAAQASHDTADLDDVVAGVRRVADELRWVMTALGDPEQTSLRQAPTGSLSAKIASIQTNLTARGFPTTVTIEGEGLDAMPQPHQAALQAVLDEAAANIERHAQPGRPCAVLAAVDPSRAEFLIINETRPGEPTPGTGIGLAGMRESLAPYAGRIDTRQEGSRWTLHVTLPVPKADSGSSSSTTTSTSAPTSAPS